MAFLVKGGKLALVAEFPDCTTVVLVGLSDEVVRINCASRKMQSRPNEPRLRVDSPQAHGSHRSEQAKAEMRGVAKGERAMNGIGKL